MSETFSMIFSVEGEDDLCIVRMRGRDAVSEPFRYEIDIAVDQDQAMPDSLFPSQKGALVWRHGDTDVRSIHGMLERVEEVIDGGVAKRTFRIVLVPRASRATLIATQQIFMKVSVPDVIEDKLGKVGLTKDDVGLNLLGTYPTREFVVQYRETDLDLLGRLTEHLGICYYFDHAQGHDRIVFSDHNDGLDEIEGAQRLAISDRLDEPDRVYKLVSSRCIIPRVYAVYDYNYRTPQQNLKAVHKVEEGHGGGILEYGCHIKTNDEGKTLAGIRGDEMRSRGMQYRGESSVVLMSTGMRTQIEGNGVDPRKMVITSVEHVAETVQGEGGGTALKYNNTFTAVDTAHTFRPQRRTPKPCINGVVTAVVQGTDGDATEADALIDEYGRYIVQFHFDSPLGTLKSKASRPVRMAQPLAGDSEGMHFPLKPGTEVAVAFMDGDPDRPIILGAIPNHTKGSVVTSSDSTLNRIQTNTGILMEFGKKVSS